MRDACDDTPDARPSLRLFVLVVVPLLVAAAVSIHWIQRPAAPEPVLGWPEEARREIQGVIESRYVEPITKERADRLFDAAMKGYVEDLDPFSRYFTEKERAALDEDMTGSFGGIGVRVDAVPAGLQIVAVRRDGPADSAGIVPGETIERVGDEPVTGRSRDAVIDMIKGAPGTTVELWLRPAGAGDLRRVVATRAMLDADMVPSVRVLAGAPPIGYLRLAQFTDTTAADARAALRSLVKDGAQSIVLDLRRNLGGVVQSAVDVASLFLPEGTLVCSARARDGSHEYHAAVKDSFEPLRLPLVVLVDESSASASEILAGALQDHGRALIVGERTYGKFVMQTVVPLANRGAMLRITTARYATPHGRSDQRDPAHDLAGGLMPDVRVPLGSRDEDDALRLEFGRQCGLAWKVLPGRDAHSGPPDRQLAAALELLRGGAAPAEPVAPRARTESSCRNREARRLHELSAGHLTSSCARRPPARLAATPAFVRAIDDEACPAAASDARAVPSHPQAPPRCCRRSGCDPRPRTDADGVRPRDVDRARDRVGRRAARPHSADAGERVVGDRGARADRVRAGAVPGGGVRGHQSERCRRVRALAGDDGRRGGEKRLDRPDTG